LKIKDEIIIIVMLITLLEINMVANNIFGDSINWIINLSLLLAEAFNLFLSVGVNANNATSEPDIKPEKINNKRHERRGGKRL